MSSTVVCVYHWQRKRPHWMRWPSEAERYEPSCRASIVDRRRCDDGTGRPRLWPAANNTLHSIHTGRLRNSPSGGVSHPKVDEQRHADEVTTWTQPRMRMPMMTARNSRSRSPVTNSRHPMSDEPESGILLPHPPK
jgi:hypothetical protein